MSIDYPFSCVSMEYPAVISGVSQDNNASVNVLRASIYTNNFWKNYCKESVVADKNYTKNYSLVNSLSTTRHLK